MGKMKFYNLSPLKHWLINIVISQYEKKRDEKNKSVKLFEVVPIYNSSK